MIQESYVTFEQAKTLKELGFPQYQGVMQETYTMKGQRCPSSNPLLKSIACPTLSLVQKWLREEKNIIIESRLYNPCNPIEFETVVYCHYDGHYFNKCFEGVYKTYEQALSAGIDKCIELLKDKENGK